jgi:exportin-T
MAQLVPLHRGAFPQDAAAAQHAIVALGNIAKGFPLRMATVTRPKISEILRAGFDSALRCLAVWPRDSLTRQRVTAFFQRLVQGIGSQVFPYALPLVTHLRTGAGVGLSD